MVKDLNITKDIWVMLKNHPDVKEGKLPELIKTITENGSYLLDVDQVTFWRLNQEAGLLYGKDQFNRETQKHEILLTISMDENSRYLKTLETKGVVAVKEVTQSPVTRELNEIYWTPQGIRSVLITPVMLRGKIFGLIQFEHKTRQKTWSQTDQQNAHRLADLVTQTILTTEINRLETQIKDFNLITRDVTAQVDDKTTFTSMLKQIANLVYVDSAAVYVANTMQADLRCAASLNIPEKIIRANIPVGHGFVGLAAERRTLVIVDDYAAFTPKDTVYKDVDFIKTSLTMPVILHGEAAAVITLHRSKIDRPFNTSDIERLRSVVEQMMLVLDLQQTVRRGQFVDLFTRVTRMTEAGMQINMFLENALRQVIQTVHADQAFLKVHKQQVRVKMTEQQTETVADILKDMGRFTNTPTVFYDVTANMELAKNQINQLVEMDIRSAVFVPVLTDRMLIGTLGIFKKEPFDWRLEDINALEAVANLIGAKTTQMLTPEMDRVSTSLLMRFSLVTENLNRLLTFKDALKNIGNGAVNIFDSNQVAVYLKDKTGNLECNWTYGLSSTYKDKFTTTVPQITSILLQNTKPVFITDTQTATYLFEKQDLIIPEGTRSFCFIPMIYEGQIVGMLGMFNKTTREWTETEKYALEAYANHATVTLQNAWLFEQIDAGYKQVALELANAMDARENAAPQYSEKLAKWVNEIGLKFGLSTQELENIRWAALLHDIGKAKVPDHILNKPGPLTSTEWNVVQQYPVEGERIVRRIPEFDDVSNTIRHLRERFDGSGYPEGKTGEDIPLASRILAVADAYGSLIDKRSYRKAMTHHEAVRELKENRGRQFDPQIVDMFVTMIDEQPVM